MPWEDFIEAYKAGRIVVRVDGARSIIAMNHPMMAKRYKRANSFWSWIFLLCFPLAVACFVWYRWWVGVFLLLVGMGLSGAVRKSANSFILDYALENRTWYHTAINEEFMVVEKC